MILRRLFWGKYGSVRNHKRQIKSDILNGRHNEPPEIWELRSIYAIRVRNCAKIIVPRENFHSVKYSTAADWIKAKTMEARSSHLVDGTCCQLCDRKNKAKGCKVTKYPTSVPPAHICGQRAATACPHDTFSREIYILIACKFATQ